MTDYREVLRDLEKREGELVAELDDIKAAKPAIQRMAKAAPPVPQDAPQSAASMEHSLVGPFTGMGTKEAILKQLSSFNGPMGVGEIANMLLSGGIKTTSQDFPAVVKSTMGQLKSEGKVERKEDGWVATQPSWLYPNAIQRPS